MQNAVPRHDIGKEIRRILRELKSVRPRSLVVFRESVINRTLFELDRKAPQIFTNIVTVYPEHATTSIARFGQSSDGTAIGPSDLSYLKRLGILRFLATPLTPARQNDPNFNMLDKLRKLKRMHRMRSRDFVSLADIDRRVAGLVVPTTPDTGIHASFTPWIP